MTAQGHLLFSVTCVLLAHKVELTPALADASLWHIVPMALASALLPDLDHPRSLLGRQLPWISGPLSGCSAIAASPTACWRWGWGSGGWPVKPPVAVGGGEGCPHRGI
ncbi:metal-dependent hydrolase [Aeromonas caviae]|uniref:metal-dependent hydrolase n=1 Tax=Aeromonas caviae TaxID=648 RepID=UPI000A6ACD6F